MKPSESRMMIDEKAIDFLESQIPELAESAMTQAYWQALASGRTVVELENGVFFRDQPRWDTKDRKDNSSSDARQDR
jgi:hypothetical protein